MSSQGEEFASTFGKLMHQLRDDLIRPWLVRMRQNQNLLLTACVIA